MWGPSCKLQRRRHATTGALISINYGVNVLPDFAVNDQNDIAFRHTELFGELGERHLSRRISTTDFQNVVIGKPASMKFAAFTLTALLDHIVPIRLGITEKKVSRIATRRMIAMMTNVKAVWNMPICNYPSNTVRKPTLYSVVKTSVAIGVLRVFPGPARGKRAFRDVCPKSLVHGFGLPVFPTNKCASQRLWDIFESGFQSKLHDVHFALLESKLQA